MFSFMMNEGGELTEKNRLIVSVFEGVVEPESFAYAKWTIFHLFPTFSTSLTYVTTKHLA